MSMIADTSAFVQLMFDGLHSSLPVDASVSESRPHSKSEPVVTGCNRLQPVATGSKKTMQEIEHSVVNFR